MVLIHERRRTVSNNDIAVYTVEEIQQMLHISRKTAYDLIKDPPFPVRKVMNQYRIPKLEFEAWLHHKFCDLDV